MITKPDSECSRAELIEKRGQAIVDMGQLHRGFLPQQLVDVLTALEKAIALPPDTDKPKVDPKVAPPAGQPRSGQAEKPFP